MTELTLSLWRSAPLDARLRFASELLAAEDPLQPALKEAIGVVHLWRRGPELEAWAKTYPSLVVDTAAALTATSVGGDEAHSVATELLREARALLDSSLRAFGFEWVTPRSGDGPTPDCRCEGEGSLITACVRPGLRHRGVLLHPAEVRLGDTSEDQKAAGPEAFPRPIRSTGSTVASSDTPDWLRAFEQCAEAPSLSAVQELASRRSGAEDGLIASAAEGLRCILASDDQGAALRAWLKHELDVDVVEPRQGEAFDAATMTAVSDRRTVHDHEAGTIARLERPGLGREGRILVPAEVVRYVAGEAW